MAVACVQEDSPQKHGRPSLICSGRRHSSIAQVVRVLRLKYADGRERQAASEAGAKGRSTAPLPSRLLEVDQEVFRFLETLQITFSNSGYMTHKHYVMFYTGEQTKDNQIVGLQIIWRTFLHAI